MSFLVCAPSKFAFCSGCSKELFCECQIASCRLSMQQWLGRSPKHATILLVQIKSLHCICRCPAAALKYLDNSVCVLCINDSCLLRRLPLPWGLLSSCGMQPLVPSLSYRPAERRTTTSPVSAGQLMASTSPSAQPHQSSRSGMLAAANRSARSRVMLPASAPWPGTTPPSALAAETPPSSTMTSGVLTHPDQLASAVCQEPTQQSVG